MALTKCAKCKREWQANSGVEPCPWCRASAAESSLAAMRQRAEEAEKGRDAAIVRAKAAEFTAHTFSVACDAHKRRAERAESCLRSIKAITDSTRIDMTRPTRALTRIEELAYAVLSAPPADASKRGGERERRWKALCVALYCQGHWEEKDHREYDRLLAEEHQEAALAQGERVKE